jgi:hypothetical protein
MAFPDADDQPASNASATALAAAVDVQLDPFVAAAAALAVDDQNAALGVASTGACSLLATCQQAFFQSGMADTTTPSSLADLGRDAFAATLQQMQHEPIITDCYSIDLETGLPLDIAKHWVMLMDGEFFEIDVSCVANLGHIPKNEREYRRCPNKPMWRTTRELKMDQYKELKMFRLIPRSEVPKGYRVYPSLWVQASKPDEAMPGTDKPTSRWCLVGTGMDRELYESYFDNMSRVSLNIMFCLRAAYSKYLAHGCGDLDNFFQATRTDVKREGDKPLPRLFCAQAPDFVEEGPNGEELVCEVLVAMQGRIDAGRISGKRLLTLILGIPDLRQSTWDPRTYVLHIGPLAGKDAPLDEIFVACENATYTPQHAPPGWMYVGTHVDDMPYVHTRCHDGKILEYFFGYIKVEYAIKFTGWQHVLGGTATVTDHDGYAIVTTDCIRLIESTVQVHVVDKGRVLIQPKHIIAHDGMDSLKSVEPFPDSDPRRIEQKMMQSEIRTLIGIGHWVGLWHPQAQFPFNAASEFGANGDSGVLSFCLHAFMYLKAHPDPPNFGGEGCTSLVLANPTVPPFTFGKKEWGFHAACDASILVKSISGGNLMLAGARFDTLCGRQHLVSPDSCTSELVAAGSTLNKIIPARGRLLELSIYQDLPTPLYIDAASTIFIIHDQRSVKKSLWTRRRALILQEAQLMQEIVALKISEADNFSDSETKNLKLKVWRRLLWYSNNLAGPMPEV